MDVLFFAFANKRENPLPGLSREDEEVYSILVHRYLKGHYSIHRDSFTSLSSINKHLGNFNDHLALFHYGGHADGKHLHLEDRDANALGIAHQLGESAKKGRLKLVVLNGCATAGQARLLLKVGVPVVIATSASVGDESAAAFSIRFFQCLCEKRMTIREAFEDALGPAQTASGKDLDIANMPRGIHIPSNCKDDEPLWGLFANSPEACDINPIPVAVGKVNKSNFSPNDYLTPVLFDTLLRARNQAIHQLHQMEKEGNYIEIGEKQTTIVNVLPYPVSIHLQKLLCPVDEENKGWDKFSLQRLKQIVEAFHTTLEFMSFVMLAQLWELKLQGIADKLPPELVSLMQDYFYQPAKQRAYFDHIPFIRAIREFFDSLHQGKGIEYFVEELHQLEGLLQKENPFSAACGHLTQLRKQTLNGSIREEEIVELCEEAEGKLCDFFKELGFMHRYTLTSIQHIDIQKYRHQLTASFSHTIVKLMRAFGKPEQNHYLLSSFLDNRGVVLLKGNVKVVNARRKQFTGDQLSMLNLSPFVIDRNAFEANADLSNLYFFDVRNKGTDWYSFKNVKRPDSENDRLQIGDEDDFEPVRLQLEAFRSTMLGETL